MKKKSALMIMATLLVAMFTAFNLQATKWVATGDDYLGSDGNVYEIYRCERRFLSTDGCEYGTYTSVCTTCTPH